MDRYTTAVIGGGAAGICAAIALGRRGEKVVLCEKMPRLGKKILATGNGRCNLLNEDLGESNYNPAARNLVKSVFSRFGKTDMLDFFTGLGLSTCSQEGRIFPVTNQAASVLKVLEMELKRLSVPVELNFDCTGISFSGSGISVNSRSGRTLECRGVILTGGGKTYPAFGSDGSLYAVAEKMGHTLVEPVPSAVPLVVKDPLCQVLQGQRIFAEARCLIKGLASAPVSGELLLPNTGFPGPVYWTSASRSRLL